MVIVYGIKNCDSCRNAMVWLEKHEIEYKFHDYRLNRLEPKLLQRWVDISGWETLLNRRGTTWRKLPKSEKEDLDNAGAIELMNTYPTLIKRPVLEVGLKILIGFAKSEKEALERIF